MDPSRMFLYKLLDLSELLVSSLTIRGFEEMRNELLVLKWVVPRNEVPIPGSQYGDKTA